MMLAALLTGLLLSASAPAIAQSDSCYMETSDGRRVNLGGLCGGESSPASSEAISRTPGQHPFPDWLVKGKVEDRKKYETGFKNHEGSSYSYAVWAYQNRFLMEFRQWPYTVSSSNRAEWDYTDCKTGWTYSRISRLSGDHPGDSAFPPGKFEDIAPGRTENLRKDCREMGIKPGF